MAQFKLMVSAQETYILAAGENVNVSDESEWGHNPGTFGKIEGRILQPGLQAVL